MLLVWRMHFQLRQHYDLSIFTASKRDYADAVIDVIDHQACIRTRLFREVSAADLQTQSQSTN